MAKEKSTPHRHVIAYCQHHDRCTSASRHTILPSTTEARDQPQPEATITLRHGAVHSCHVTVGPLRDTSHICHRHTLCSSLSVFRGFHNHRQERDTSWQGCAKKRWMCVMRHALRPTPIMATTKCVIALPLSTVGHLAFRNAKKCLNL